MLITFRRMPVDGVSRLAARAACSGAGQVGSLTLSTAGGPADFAERRIFVSISDASAAVKPTLKPSMPRNRA